MAAPEFVPPSYADRPRDSLPIPPSGRWMADRPADLRRGQPVGPQMGRQGPDQGYALALAGRFDDRLRLAEGEHREDVIAGAVSVAMRRASMLGRAPVIHDLEHAFCMFGYLDDDPPADLLAWRKRMFAGASHDYWDQRAIVDPIPDDTFRLKPSDLRNRLGEWQKLVGAAG